MTGQFQTTLSNRVGCCKGADFLADDDMDATSTKSKQVQGSRDGATVSHAPDWFKLATQLSGICIAALTESRDSTERGC
jgi:hypothetical protein